MAKEQTQVDSRMKDLQTFFEGQEARLKTFLTKELTFERLVAIVLSNASRNPALLECTLLSVYSSVHQALQMGLEPGGPLKQAHLVPFWNRKVQPNVRECVMIPGYSGLVTLARRSGEILDISSKIVGPNDEFDYEEGDNPIIKHRPELVKSWKQEDFKCAYMIARFKDGGKHHEVMTRDDIHHIMSKSKAKDDGPWKTDMKEMVRKTVLKRGLKMCPMSIQLAEAIQAEDDALYDSLKDVTVTATEPASPGEVSTVSGIKRPAAKKKEEPTLAPQLQSPPPTATEEIEKSAPKKETVPVATPAQQQTTAQTATPPPQNAPASEGPQPISINEVKSKEMKDKTMLYYWKGVESGLTYKTKNGKIADVARVAQNEGKKLLIHATPEVLAGKTYYNVEQVKVVEPE